MPGTHYCDECGTFMGRAVPGDLCPTCGRLYQPPKKQARKQIRKAP